MAMRTAAYKLLDDALDEGCKADLFALLRIPEVFRQDSCYLSICIRDKLVTSLLEDQSEFFVICDDSVVHYSEFPLCVGCVRMAICR